MSVCFTVISEQVLVERQRTKTLSGVFSVLAPLVPCLHVLPAMIAVSGNKVNNDGRSGAEIRIRDRLFSAADNFPPCSQLFILKDVTR